MEKQLNTEPNFVDPDAFYEALMDAHRTLTREDSERFNARLVLLLSNHIGDIKVLKEALAIAGDLEPLEADTAED
ncbi:DUF2783 domain-containing protein [Alteromonas sp. a30]|uniref:DUF2783 domain-containing protein n=1 Tax=Alteromonas sp. a30 TaxID=2730917 RepID=UPI00228290B3|nr:DUF2783 domain-containing protein [Alteromonas sp. a30]MCY7295234.1 DUF2783 domain-containing protein [Alteromonas sp. a30]